MLADSVGVLDASGARLEQSGIGVKANITEIGLDDVDLATALNGMNDSHPGVKFEDFFVAESARTSERVSGFVRNGDPFMAGFKTSANAAHAIVVDGITTDGLVMIRDPEWSVTGEGARYEMTVSDFLRAWNGSGVEVVR